jgi:hypothetical protein
VSTSESTSSEKPSWKSGPLIPAYITAIAALITALGGFVGGRASANSSGTPQSTATATKTAIPTIPDNPDTTSLQTLTEQFTINSPSQSIPFCNTFSGSGPAMADYKMVMFYQAADADQHDRTGVKVYYAGTPVQSGNSWLLRNVQIGSGTPSDAGTYWDIYLIALPNYDAKFVADLAPLTHTYGELPEYFPHTASGPHVYLRRNGDTTKCSP